MDLIETKIMYKLGLIRVSALLIVMLIVFITADAQIVFTKFKEKDAPESSLIRYGISYKGITASYTITSEKKIKEWRLRYYPINKDGDAITIGSTDGSNNEYSKFSILGNDGPFRPNQKYTWTNRALTKAYYVYKYIPYQLEILYADNSAEIIKIRKDNFKKYFPNNKWIDTDILDLSLDDPSSYLPPQKVNKKSDDKTPNLLVKSEVDTDIPTVQIKNADTYAVIIANENYQEVATVDYAQNDGEVFKQYCNKVLGIPEENIHLRKNATKNNMIAEMSWMRDVAKAYNGKAKFIVFYAGHGFPDEKSKTAYLLPIDGIATNSETAYSLAKFYQELSGMGAARVTIFMDACFSGAQRGDGMLASARGVAVRAKSQNPTGKMVVFSAAQGDETAYPYKEKGHGMFTYYLLKKLRECKGECTYSELAEYIKTNVNQQSVVINRKSQTPTVTASQVLAASWKSMRLK